MLRADSRYVIFSSRDTDSLIKADAKTGDVVYVLGGADGQFDIQAPDGTQYPAGYSYWYGQHNGEYIGDGEYALFDNHDNEVSERARIALRCCAAAADARRARRAPQPQTLGSHSRVVGFRARAAARFFASRPRRRVVVRPRRPTSTGPAARACSL